MKRHPAFRLVDEQRCDARPVSPEAHEDFTVFPRTREIIDITGSRLRVSVELRLGDAVMTLERPAAGSGTSAVLDGYGIEVLSSYIMAARLALPSGLPDERIDGHYPWVFSLNRRSPASMVLRQDCTDQSFDIPAPFWDRLYAELCMVKAHISEQGRRSTERLH